MRRFVIWCLLLAMLTAMLPVAVAADVNARRASFDITANGKPVNAAAYAIDGNTYLRLVDIAAALNVYTAWDSEVHAARIITSMSYRGDAPAPATAADNVNAQTATFEVIVNDDVVDATAYAIDGNTYVRLVDITRALNIHSYFEEGTVYIESDKPFGYVAPPEPEPEPAAPPPDSLVGTTPADKPVVEEPEEIFMSVTSTGIKKGMILSEYGKFGTQMVGTLCTQSLPLTIADAPEGTVSFVVIMKDIDSVAEHGFEVAHWLAANITTNDIPKNASIGMASEMVQGKNGFNMTGYAGPIPPDKPHEYRITVYALDTMLDLKDGFLQSQLLAAMKDHILEEAELIGMYDGDPQILTV